MKVRILGALACCALVAGAAAVAAQNRIRVRIGTVVPKGSLWDETLQRIRQEWIKIVGDRLEVTIIASGQLGDEPSMVRDARQGKIQAVGLSSVGLARIDSGVACLQIPMLLESYEELDFVRDRMAPELERRIEAQNFKVLHWADGGWVYAFSKTPAPTPTDLKKLKLFTSAGDPTTEALYKDLGFNVVPLAMTDLVPFLQNGTVEAFATVPLFAQLQELYRLAPNMTNIKWTPLVGGTVITKAAWDNLPNEHKPALLDAAQRQGSRLRAEIRKMDEDAIKAMQARKLNVIAVDASGHRAWESEAQHAFPKLRGNYCPADLFDTVVKLRNEYREKRPAAK